MSRSTNAFASLHASYSLLAEDRTRVQVRNNPPDVRTLKLKRQTFALMRNLKASPDVAE
jgi:hypothetical protein